MDFTLFFVSTATPSFANVMTSLTHGAVSSSGVTTLASGLQIAENSAEVLEIDDVPSDQFDPNVPGTVFKINEAPSYQIDPNVPGIVLKINDVRPQRSV